MYNYAVHVDLFHMAYQFQCPQLPVGTGVVPSLVWDNGPSIEPVDGGWRVGTMIHAPLTHGGEGEG